MCFFLNGPFIFGKHLPKTRGENSRPKPKWSEFPAQLFFFLFREKKPREKRRGARSANFEQASISPHEIGGKVDYRSFFPFFSSLESGKNVVVGGKNPIFHYTAAASATHFYSLAPTACSRLQFHFWCPFFEYFLVSSLPKF